MDVKWRLAKAGTGRDEAPDYLGNQQLYTNGKMSPFSALTFNDMGEFHIPPKTELLFIGGKTGIAAALKQSRGSSFITKNPTMMYVGRYKGSIFNRSEKTYTKVIITDFYGMTPGGGLINRGMYDIIFGEDRITPAAYFMPVTDVVETLSRLK